MQVDSLTTFLSWWGFSMSQKPKAFYAPNGKDATVERWRKQGRIMAVGYITHRGGSVSGKELASVLGVSPRALRNLLVRDGSFLVEYRAHPNFKDEAWYRIAPKSIEPIILPPLRREALPDGGRAPRIKYSGGPTPAIERFMAPAAGPVGQR